MTTELRFQEYKGALLIRATKHQGLLNATGSAAVAGAFVAIIVQSYAKSFLFVPGIVAAVVVAAIVGFARGRFPLRADLSVTNLEFASRSFGMWGTDGTQSISRVDVRWLEYEEDASGPESDHPGGLYAVLKHRSVCILPHLTEEQTLEVIERIAKKFPDFREQWLNQSAFSDSAFGGHFISVGLDRPNSRS